MVARHGERDWFEGVVEAIPEAHDGGIVGYSEEGEASRDGDDVYRPDLVPIDVLAKYAIDDAVRPFQLKQIFDKGLGSGD